MALYHSFVVSSWLVSFAFGNILLYPALSVSMTDKGRPLPKFGEWDENDPSSAEGFTVIFNKARNEKKSGSKAESPGYTELNSKSEHGLNRSKSQPKRWLCCVQAPDTLA
ncbi:hypothetical protein Droror1_Dr00014291 [Drosera rotundifolia]